jgi:AmmeMemoRadiSam system protein A
MMSAPLLLQIARDSIVEVLEANRIINKADILNAHPILNEPLACFVTLYLEDELRGASGCVKPESSLLDTIIHHAKIAAFQDPRFTPLSTSEYLHVRIELSLLTPLHHLTYSTLSTLKEQITPMQDGVYVQHAQKQSAFLPQVWQQLESFESFFTYLLKEIDLSPDALPADLQVYTFQIEKEQDEPIIIE